MALDLRDAVLWAVAVNSIVGAPAKRAGLAFELVAWDGGAELALWVAVVVLVAI
jgi:hypothetical protein